MYIYIMYIYIYIAEGLGNFLLKTQYVGPEKDVRLAMLSSLSGACKAKQKFQVNLSQ